MLDPVDKPLVIYQTAAEHGLLLIAADLVGITRNRPAPRLLKSFEKLEQLNLMASPDLRLQHACDRLGHYCKTPFFYANFVQGSIGCGVCAM